MFLEECDKYLNLFRLKKLNALQDRFGILVSLSCQKSHIQQKPCMLPLEPRNTVLVNLLTVRLKLSHQTLIWIRAINFHKTRKLL